MATVREPPGFFGLCVGALAIALLFPVAWWWLLPTAERPPLLDPEGGLGPASGSQLAERTAAHEREFGGDDALTLIIEDSGDGSALWSDAGVEYLRSLEAGLGDDPAFLGVRGPVGTPILRLADGVVQAARPLAEGAESPLAERVAQLRADPLLQGTLVARDGGAVLISARIRREGGDHGFVAAAERAAAGDTPLALSLRRQVDEARLAVLLGSEAGPPEVAVARRLRAAPEPSRGWVLAWEEAEARRLQLRDGGALQAARSITSRIPPPPGLSTWILGPHAAAEASEKQARPRIALLLAATALTVVIGAGRSSRRAPVWPLLGAAALGAAAPWAASGFRPLSLVAWMWLPAAAAFGLLAGLRVGGVRAGAATLWLAAVVASFMPSARPGPPTALDLASPAGFLPTDKGLQALVRHFGTEGPIHVATGVTPAGSALGAAALRADAGMARCLAEGGNVEATLGPAELAGRLLAAMGSAVDRADDAAIEQVFLVFGSPVVVATVTEASRTTTNRLVLPKAGRTRAAMDDVSRCSPGAGVSAVGRVPAMLERLEGPGAGAAASLPLVPVLLFLAASALGGRLVLPAATAAGVAISYGVGAPGLALLPALALGAALNLGPTPSHDRGSSWLWATLGGLPLVFLGTDLGPFRAFVATTVTVVLMPTAVRTLVEARWVREALGR